MELEIIPVLDDQELKAALENATQVDSAVQTLRLTAGGCRDAKGSVLDPSFHLRSSANSLQRASSSQTTAEPETTRNSR